MKTLRITGVPEHFNYPWKKVIDSQPFLQDGIRLEWIDESRGSGQMNSALRAKETEIALVLTESFLKDFEAGNPSRMIGFHVKSPLLWGIHIAGKSSESTLDDLERHDFLISREGSGSHLMAYVLAQRQNWESDSLTFKVVGNLQGALEVMDSQHPEMFLWEKFTTMPWVDSGEMKRIGEVPSPWSCFVIVASTSALSEFGDVIFKVRDLVYKEAIQIENSENALKDISTAYDLKLENVKKWFAQTKWATSPTLSRQELTQSMDKMVDLGILKKIQKLEDFLVVDRVQIED